MNDTILVKESEYNMVLQEYNKSILVFNTLQDSISLIKKDIPYGKMSLKSIDILHKQGILINEAINELQIIRHRANVQKYGGKRLHVFITLTGACNCNCQYCFAKDCYSEGRITEKDIPYIISFIKQQMQINRSSLLNVDFFGGEPLLCEKIYLELMTQITEYCNLINVSPEFQFYTNGTIEPSCGFEVLKRFPKSRLLITLDGLKEIHEGLRPLRSGKSSYDASIKNLKTMQAIGVKAVIRINYGKESFRNVPFLLDELIRLGLTGFPVEFYPVQNMSDKSSDYPEAVDSANLVKINEFLWSEAEKRGIGLALRTTSSNCYCTAFTNSMFVIDPMLNVYKCALLQCDRKYSIGNLRKQTQYNRDNTYYDWLTYDPTVETPCSQCISLPICAGGCGGSGTFRHGTHHHSNCYDLSPLMVKKRMLHYFCSKYSAVVNRFEQSDLEVLSVEYAKYAEP